MKELPTPKTQKQEVLYELIRNRTISYENFNYMQGYRMRMSELRRHLHIISTPDKRTNKYGNHYIMMYHTLPESEVEKAVKLYLSMQKNNEKG